MRTFFCFLIPRTDVAARLAKRCALLFSFCMLLTSVNSNAQTMICPGGLDSIQQVAISVACNGDITVFWDTHPGKCYGFTTGSGSILGTGVDGSITFNPATSSNIISGGQFNITEACTSDPHVNPCGGSGTANATSVDLFSGVLPNINSVGTWHFDKSSSGGNTTIDGSIFTVSSPSDIPNLNTISGISGSGVSIIRPSGAGTSDAKYTIQTAFNANTLDSIILSGDNASPAISSGVLSSSAVTHTFPLLTGVSSGTQSNQIVAFSGGCTSTVNITTDIQEGSDVPSMACHGEVNVSLTGSGTIIKPSMFLPGQSVTNRIAFIEGTQHDSIVDCSDSGSIVNVVVMDTIHSQKCWGRLVIEDKSLLRATAIPDTTFTCLQNMDALDPADFVTIMDNCSEIGDVEITYADEYIDGDCSGDTLRLINRTWIIKDNRGRIVNVTTSIAITAVDLSVIVFPQDTVIYCPDTSIAITNTGGINFNIDTIGASCMIMVSSSDREIPVSCSGMRKIERTWLAVDWCNRGVTRRDTQFITLLDTLPPTIICEDCVPNQKLISDSDACGTLFKTPEVSATDNCSDDSSIDIEVRVNGVFSDIDALFIPVGSNVIEYIARDDCGNESSRIDTIIVVDESGPLFSVIPTVQIALSGADGLTWVPVSMLSGAFSITDNCTAVETLEIRRMETLCNVPSDTTFGESIGLCCADSDGNVMVMLKATDVNGASTTRMMTIDVKDPVTPTLTCQDTTVYLDANDTYTVQDSSLFVSGVTDNCLDNLTYSYSPATFTSTGAVAMTVTVSDLEGNTATCISNVTVLDTISNVTGGNTPNSAIFGKVVDPYDRGIANMNIDLLNNNEIIDNQLTDLRGGFSFDDMSMTTESAVQLRSTGGSMDGVSSLDLFLIQKHILGLQQLENGFVELAADIDRSGSISVIDLLYLQNAILGRKDAQELPWIYLSENTSASEIYFTSNEVIPFEENDILYRGIKIGDVSGDTYDIVSGRSNESESILIKEHDLRSSEYYEIPIYLFLSDDMVSFEMSLNLEHVRDLSFVPNLNNAISTESLITDGRINLVAFGDNELEGKIEIGVLAFTSEKNQSIKDAINTRSSENYKLGKLYNGNHEQLDLDLGWIEHDESDVIDLENMFRMYPNPASDIVHFDLNVKSENIISFKILDITGREVRNFTGMDISNFTIPTSLFPSSGSYFISLETKEGVQNDILLINKK